MKTAGKPQTPESPAPNTGLPLAACWGVAILLLAAAFLRLYRLDLISFTQDEGSHALIAMTIPSFEFERWPLAGLPSVGIRNSALFLYLLGLAYGIYWHPLSGAVLVAGLNIAAAYLLFRICERYIGMVAAVTATVLYAVSPWSVLYSRQMWPPSCVAFFSLLLIWLALAWLERPTSRKLIGLTVLGFLLPQVHFSGFCAPVWLMAVLWMGRKHLRLKPLVIGLSLGITTWLPWLYFQQIINWADFRKMGHVARGEQSALQMVVQMIDYFQGQLHSGNFDFWFVENDSLPVIHGWLAILCRAVSVLLVTWFVVSVCYAIRHGNDRLNLLMLLWIAIPLLLLTLLRPKIQPHYLLIAFPIPFLLMGSFAGRMLERSGKPIRYLSMAALVIVVFAHLGFLGAWYGFVESGQTRDDGFYRMSYRQRCDVVQSIVNRFKRWQAPLAGAEFADFNPPYEPVYVYVLQQSSKSHLPVDQSRRLWIEPIPNKAFRSDDTKTAKERVMTETMALRMPSHPSVTIVDSWTVGPAEVYQLHLK